MNILQAFVLGLVQGLTEFLPVSSSGHLVLVPWWLGWDPPPLVFDTTLHLGTILAVIAYFHRDLWDIVVSWVRGLIRREMISEAWLGWWIILGTIPAALVGFFLEDIFENFFAFPLAVAVLLIVTGLILTFSERFSNRRRALMQMDAVDAVIIGFAQACAILPGISRSGATIAAGLGRGFKREEAARFSFFLAVPIVVGTGLVQLLKLFLEPVQGLDAGVLLVGFLAAAVSGYLAIHWLLRYLQRNSLYPFAIYCWIVGGISLIAVLVLL